MRLRLAVTGRSQRFPEVPGERRDGSPRRSTRPGRLVAASTWTSPDGDLREPHRIESTGR
jgi:hypothetical protein